MLEHYLISMPLIPHSDRSIHCYLITAKGHRDIETAAAKMFESAVELIGNALMIPLFTCTGPLEEEHTKIIRDIIIKDPAMKDTLKTTTDFCLNIFIATSEDDDALMKIH